MLGVLREGAHIRAILTLLALFALGGCASDVVAPAPATAAESSGTISFPTAGSLQRGSDGRFVMRDDPAVITGELRLPEGKGPFPAIVLAHGCNGTGNGGVERAWGHVLRGWGYATFNIDSFHGRGISEVCTQSGVLIRLQRVPDAYGARSFRAFIPFYPNCNGAFPERNRVVAPVRIHTGDADDWTPAKPCAELAAALKAAGQDVAIHVYPGAHHGFDQAPPREIRLPNVNNGSACFPQSPSILGPVARSSVAGCLTKGATIAGSPSAAEQARRNLHAQLEELMR